MNCSGHRTHIPSPGRIVALYGLITVAALPLWPAPPAPQEADPAGTQADAQQAAPTRQAATKMTPSQACSTGVAKDDGGVESGYGFVPSSTSGTYLQKFDSQEFASKKIDTVCLCWLKTRGGSNIEFNVVFYADVGGRPAPAPYASIAASATGVARSKETAGDFFSVDVESVRIPNGPFYVGAHWNPSEQDFLFICNDRSPETEKTDVFFRENVQPVWSHVATSRDPIFAPHRAVMIRAVAAPEESSQPTGSEASAAAAAAIETKPPASSTPDIDTSGLGES